MKRASLALLLAALGLGCGYNTGFLVSKNVGSIGVEVFDNTSKVRDLEADVHDHLTESLRSRTEAHLVPPSLAELVIRGRVLDYSRRSGIRSRDNQLLETGVQIAVEAELVRRRADPDAQEEVLRRIQVEEESGFRLQEANGELDARDRVLRRLADRIVLELLSEFTQEASPPSQN
ncbi:MAG: hypothetical protein HZA52_02405 [Planctomycetes bacterium]|nr:hypothetical protein [Planctomycetota bacterium]